MPVRDIRVMPRPLDFVLRRPAANRVLYLPGWLTADGKLADYSGLGNHGTIVGATKAALPSGLCVWGFDGSDDRVRVNDSASVDITDTITLLFWVKLAATFSAQGEMISKHYYAAAGNNSGYRIRVLPNRTVNLTLYNNGVQDFTTTGTIALSTWTLVCATYTGVAGGVMSIYLNDAAAETLSGQTLGIKANNLYLYLGCEDYNNDGTVGSFLKAQAALHTVLNTALTSAQRTNIYERGKDLVGV